jgi:hypothetical protein
MGSAELPPFHLAFPVHDLVLARDFYIKYDLVFLSCFCFGFSNDF